MWIAEAILEAPEDQEIVSPYRYRPHLRISGADRGDQGELTLFLNPRRESLILPLFGSAGAIASILAFIPGHLVSQAMRGVRILAAVPVVADVVVLGMLALGLLDAVSGQDAASYEVAVWGARVAVLSTFLLLPALVFPTLGRLFRPAIRRGQRAASKTSRALALVALVLLVLGTVAILLAAGELIYTRVPF